MSNAGDDFFPACRQTNLAEAVRLYPAANEVLVAVRGTEVLLTPSLSSLVRQLVPAPGLVEISTGQHPRLLADRVQDHVAVEQPAAVVWVVPTVPGLEPVSVGGCARYCEVVGCGEAWTLKTLKSLPLGPQPTRRPAAMYSPW